MNRRMYIQILLAAIVIVPSLCFAFVSTHPKGKYPGPLPRALEAYRSILRVVEVAHGIQETNFELLFESQAEFELAWPKILGLRSPNAPLILEQSPSASNVSGSKMGPGIRVFWPSEGSCRKAGGELLKASAPWPASIKSPSGELPEYVIASKETWVPYLDESQEGFRNRARVDIVLVVDGNIVDLNRIPLPLNTPIIDNRFKDK